MHVLSVSKAYFPEGQYSRHFLEEVSAYVGGLVGHTGYKRICTQCASTIVIIIIGLIGYIRSVPWAGFE